MLTDEQIRALREELHHRHGNAAAEARDAATSAGRALRMRARRDALAETIALLAAIEQGRPYRN
jgi:hypothetical protein